MKIETTLLIVDDESDLRDILAQDLKPLASHVLTAADGREALSKIEGDQVTAVLSDIQMPKMSGFQLLAEIRRRGLYIPLVYMTAFADREKSALAADLGAFEFLEKPFDRAAMHATVHQALLLGASLRDPVSLAALPEFSRARHEAAQQAVHALAAAAASSRPTTR